MKFRTIICLLLALILIMLCIAGCRKDKQENNIDQSKGKTDEIAEEMTEHQESNNVEDLNEPMEIEIPEGMEIGEGGDDFDR